MALICQDFTINSGDDRNLIFTVKDNDGIVVDVSGILSAQWVLKRYSTDTTALITNTLTAGDITNSPGTDGKLTIILVSTDTSSLAHGRYYHELRIVDAASNTITIAIGKAEIIPADSL